MLSSVNLGYQSYNINIKNSTSQNTSLNSQNARNSNLVTHKSQAVSESLGYGVIRMNILQVILTR
ncbi:hypothetical protein FMM54_05515, partial [Campylobacter sp. LR185c]